MAGTLADSTGLPAGKHAKPALTKPSAADCEATAVTVATPAASPAAAAAVGAAGACESAASDDFLLSSFRGKLSLAEAEGPAGGAGQLAAAGAGAEPLPPELAAEESAGSTASAATSMGAISSSVFDSPQVAALDSPLAAFAAARDRLTGALTRGNSSGSREASSLSALSSLRRQQGQERAGANSSARRSSAPAGQIDAAAAAAAAADGSAPGLSLQPRRLARSQSGSSSLGSAGSAPPEMAVIQQRNLRLKERLQSTLALCNTLQEQNQQSMQRVAQLWENNQRLSRSLQGARLDKDGLQHTIRQLTVEAAMLAEQARQALVPLKGQLEEEERSEAADEEAAARREVEVHQQQEEQGGVHSPEAISIGAIASPASAAGLSPRLAPGDSTATSVASRAEGADSRQEQQSPGVPPAHADSASSCLTGGSGEAAVAVASATGDKRRRLLPSLAPVIVETAAQAAAAEVSVGSCRVPTPGYTPRRKIRHGHADSQGTAAATAGAAAGSPAAGPPAAAADPEADPPAAATAALEPASLGSSQAHQPPGECSGLAASPGSSGAVLVAAVPDVVAAAQGVDAGAEEYEFETFALFDRMWFGCTSSARSSRKRLAAPPPLPAPACRGQLSSSPM